MGIKRLTEVRDEHGRLTHKMCCICFAMVPIAELYVCDHDHKWDMCEPDGIQEGCLCKEVTV